jgi:hypothetical protein
MAGRGLPPNQNFCCPPRGRHEGRRRLGPRIPASPVDAGRRHASEGLVDRAGGNAVELFLDGGELRDLAPGRRPLVSGECCRNRWLSVEREIEAPHSSAEPTWDASLWVMRSADPGSSQAYPLVTDHMRALKSPSLGQMLGKGSPVAAAHRVPSTTSSAPTWSGRTTTVSPTRTPGSSTPY